MTENSAPSSPPRPAVDWLYYLTAVFFVLYLFAYYLATRESHFASQTPFSRMYFASPG